MELKVKVSTNLYEGFELEQTIANFDDAEKIGLRVGRAVRDWLRNVPISRNGRLMRLEVGANWLDGDKPVPTAIDGAGAVMKPKRRRRKKS
jgi:hypothetical protein